MAHITGNLVILAAHYVTGKFGEIGPILSVPIFMLVLSVVTLALVAVPIRVARRALLVLQASLLAAFLSFGVAFGPFSNPDSGLAVLVGMLGVAAMATQNAVVRLALHGSPSTAVMKMRPLEITGEEWPGGRSTFHSAFLSGPNSMGRF